MERLQAAIEKARAHRSNAAKPSNDAIGNTPRPEADEPNSFSELAQLTIDERAAARHRIIAARGSKAAAPFDLLRTRVRQQTQKEGWRRVAVVSPHAGAGKTTVATNLAFAFGRQKDVRTIVLDFDLRRPALAKVIGQTPRHNMADVIEGEVDFATHGLHYGDNLAFGLNDRPARNSSELLQDVRTSRLLTALDQRYAPDLLLFDMSPLLVTDDGFGFLRQVDCALIVVEAESTPMSQIDVIERQVAEITNVLGIVLNKCNYTDGLYGSDYGKY